MPQSISLPQELHELLDEHVPPEQQYGCALSQQVPLPQSVWPLPHALHELFDEHVPPEQQYSELGQQYPLPQSV